MRILISTALAILCMGSMALAESEPYIMAGQRLAEANCAPCHNIQPGGAFKLYPPSFASIAAYMEPEVIRMKIMYPDHAAMMPQFHKYMFAENVDNLVGYIVSLEGNE